METVKERVAKLLRDDENLRNDDLALAFAYWRKYDSFNPRLPHAPLTSPETIHRARQKLNEKGLYLATDPKVRQRRRRREDEIRKWAVDAEEDEDSEDEN